MTAGDSTSGTETGESPGFVDRRTLLWALLVAGFMLVSFHRVTSAVLADDLTRAFDTTGTELGMLHAAFFYIYAALQLPAGVLIDRAGIRRVATVGLLVMSVGVFGFALAESYVLAFAMRALLGLGGSVLYIAALRFIANWYRPDEFATMTGLTIAGSGMGGLLASTPLALAVEGNDWRVVIAAVGLAGLGLAVVTYLLVRDRPGDVGRTIEGVAADETTSDLRTVLANARRVLAEPETWAMGLFLFLIIGTNFAVLGLWGVPYVADLYDVSVSVASTVMLAANVGFLLGSPILGRLSDRLEWRTELLVGSAVVFTLAYGVIAVLVTPPFVVTTLLLMAALFVMGGAGIAYTVAKERHPPDTSATVMGTVNSMGYFGAAVFPGVMGVILDTYWTGETVAGARVYTVTGYRIAFTIATAAGVLAVVCAVWLHLRETRVGPEVATAEPTD